MWKHKAEREEKKPFACLQSHELLLLAFLWCISKECFVSLAHPPMIGCFPSTCVTGFQRYIMHTLDEEGAPFGALFWTHILHRKKIFLGRMHNILSTSTSLCVCCVYHWDLLFPSICQNRGLSAQCHQVLLMALVAHNLLVRSRLVLFYFIFVFI